ncbi:hypothetical protein AUEXF2481DRAFT_639232 [Aureobasidium subglaciale EXF-2481]|uniref:Uncharacterized protein n=1 Tax=Aureobasidium subglaciale (strain EXF-2481) TaxID=1043005 RepID=A0A074YK42_AURSE|nr:uncharacterized protein AUEXF2481DRAFT_639232 [Aureobasidium subglaciale EXF-2481]KEQ96449.1 hypothetical protein AUEXF2481DRAFT_639232 [Aureobasidium subglaciale EXF-2481]
MEEVEQRSSPLAGPGTTRANRRLQLRKNGFRGRALPNRNITPKRNISDAWSSPAPQDNTPTSDLPQAESARTDLSTRGRSSSILQEVSNSSLRRKDKNKHKHDSALSIFADENGQEKLWSFESSPACLPPEAPNLTKSRKKHARTQSYKSNPDTEQADQHIAYLESELAVYQTQLASLTSPSVTKEKGQKLRLLGQDIRRLEEENARWEAEFDERVLQVMQEHDGIEYNLRARINMLEADSDNYAQKVKELQAQLDATRKALDIAESANIEFEKRLETFAHLLVTSPIKSETPLAQPPFTKESRSTRQKRLSFHRFPTAGSLHQASMFEQHEHEESRPHSEPVVQDYFDNPVSDAEWDPSKRESIISDASRNSIDFSLFLNNEPPPSSSRARPNRRMRRFHGGSHLPKPLILSAAQLAPIPASAPPHEPHESPRAFPFPDIDLVPRRASCHEFSPLTGRRRAKTTTDGLDPSLLQPFSRPTNPPMSLPCSADQEDTTPTPQQTSSDSNNTSTDYSSIGPNLGRNLLEELSAVRHDEDSQTASSGPTPFATLISKPPDFSSHSTSIQRNISGAMRLRHQRSMSEATGLSLYPPSRQVSSSRPTPLRPNGVLAKVKELLRSPWKLARRCVRRAHQAFLLSRTVNRIQWVLLHALLGPMATRRLMACSLHESAVLMQSPCRSSSSSRRVSAERQRREKEEEEEEEEEGFDANEEVEGSPCPLRRRRIPHSSSSSPSSSCVFETTTKEIGNRSKKVRQEAPMLSRHSPWLWVRFSLTLAFAVAAAIREGPGALMMECQSEGGCEKKECACLGCMGRELRKCRDD